MPRSLLARVRHLQWYGYFEIEQHALNVLLHSWWGILIRSINHTFELWNTNNHLYIFIITFKNARSDAIIRQVRVGGLYVYFTFTSRKKVDNCNMRRFFLPLFLPFTTPPPLHIYCTVLHYKINCVVFVKNIT